MKRSKERERERGESHCMKCIYVRSNTFTAQRSGIFAFWEKRKEKQNVFFFWYTGIEPDEWAEMKRSPAPNERERNRGEGNSILLAKSCQRRHRSTSGCQRAAKERE